MSTAPAQWLRTLLPTNHVEHFPWSWAVRSCVGMALILVTGALTGKLDLAVFAAIGMLLNSATQHPGAGRVNLAQMAIAVPLGIFGHFVGVLANGPVWRHVLVLAVLAAISAIISAFGAAYSIGSIEMMVLAVISAAVPGKGPWWIPVLLFVVGSGLAALLLVIDMLFQKDRPERTAYAELLRALATLMRQEAKGSAGEEQRQAVMDAQQSAYQNLLQDRLRAGGESSTTDGRAAALGVAAALRNRVFVGGASTKDLLAGADHLDQIADAFVHGEPQPPADTNSGVFSEDIDKVAKSLWDSESRKALIGLYVRAHPVGSFRMRVSRALDVGSSALRDAARLALCIGAAVWIASLMNTHSFWIPLMVVTIMKPDFGSVFRRAIQRSIGTVIGAVAGAILVLIVPDKGIWMALLISAIAFFMPWGSRRGFWVMSIFITALVVPMVSWLDNKPGGVLAWDRVLDTLIAGVLALVFGYLLWPTTYKAQVQQKVNQQIDLITALLRAVVVPDVSVKQAERTIARSRASAYRGLSNLHIHLQRALAEPGPIGKYEAAWFPVVATPGRMCDILTGYSIARERDPKLRPPQKTVVDSQVEGLQSLERENSQEKFDSSSAINDFNREVGHLAEIMAKEEDSQVNKKA